MNEVEGKAKKDELFPPKIEIKSFIHRKKEKKRSHVKLMQKLVKKNGVLIDAVGTRVCQSWWWERLGKTEIGNRFVCVFGQTTQNA